MGRDDVDAGLLARSGMRCSAYAPYNEQQCVALSNAWNKWLMRHDGSGEHIVEFEAGDNSNGPSLRARVDLKSMPQTTSAANSDAPRCAVRMESRCPSLW